MSFDDPTRAKVEATVLTFDIINMLTVLDGTVKDNIPKIRKSLDKLEIEWDKVANGL